jgi:hypothetical protein
VPLSTYRVLVTGSRDWPWTHYGWIAGALDMAVLAARSAGCGLLVVVHGGAEGVDKMSGRWAEDNPVAGGWLPVVEEIHRAGWGVWGKPAGHRRNAQMVGQGANECLPFIGPCTRPTCPDPEPHGSHGATGCLERAMAAGIPVPNVWRL